MINYGHITEARSLIPASDDPGVVPGDPQIRKQAWAELACGWDSIITEYYGDDRCLCLNHADVTWADVAPGYEKPSPIFAVLL